MAGGAKDGAAGTEYGVFRAFPARVWPHAHAGTLFFYLFFFFIFICDAPSSCPRLPARARRHTFFYLFISFIYSSIHYLVFMHQTPTRVWPHVHAGTPVDQFFFFRAALSGIPLMLALAECFLFIYFIFINLRLFSF